MRRSVPLLAIVLAAAAGSALLLPSCGGGGGGGSSGGGGGTTGGSSGGGGGAFGLTRRETLPPLAFPLSGPGNPTPTPVTLSIATAFPSVDLTASPLLMDSLVGLFSPRDGTNRIFAVDQRGRILVFPNRANVTNAEVSVFLDIESRVDDSSDEEGLLGLAFDADFATNGRFYVNYIRAGASATVISRFTVTPPNGNSASATSEVELLRVTQPYSNHNGGMIAVGPDRMLYIGMGDGGSGNDPGDVALDRTSLLGKMLRIDPNGGTPYGIPSTNPFATSTTFRREIYAYGLRNPWRFSFDRQTGELWCADVGQNAQEEIDRITNGGNYGWRVFEGTAQTGLGTRHTGLAAPTAPVHAYAQGSSTGRCIIGGYVYRGTATPALAGAYIFGDYASGCIFSLAGTTRTQIGTVTSVTAFGEDEAGEILIASRGGQIFKIVQTGGGGGTTNPFPQRLSDTGLFTNVASLAPVPGLIEYDVSAPLWSDGAAKRRWIALPNGTTIDFHPSQPWTFPLGTVLVKHFEIETQVGNPASVKRLETRVLVNETNGWAGYTYRWNAQQTDADLLSTAATETLTIQDPAAPGGVRQQTWTYPSRADCLSCHTSAARGPLGVRTGQLNHAFDYPNARDNQLRSWNHIGLFSSDIGNATNYVAFPDPGDAAQPLAARARAYLAANCAQCHLPGGPAPGGMDFRYETPLDAMNVVGVAPQSGTLGIPGAMRVAPGARTQSILWERMRRLDSYRMPPLASHVLDAEAIDLIGQWIDAGPTQ